MSALRTIAVLALAAAPVALFAAPPKPVYSADEIEKALNISCEDQNRPTLPNGKCGAPYADDDSAYRVLFVGSGGGAQPGSTAKKVSGPKVTSSTYTRPKPAVAGEAAVKPIYADVNYDLQVTFANASSALSEQAKANATAFAEAINRPSLANARFEIAGHTNAVGNEEYNVELSNQRAAALIEFLVSKGVDPSRLVAKGYGFAQLYVTNQPRAAANRRVEARRLND